MAGYRNKIDEDTIAQQNEGKSMMRPARVISLILVLLLSIGISCAETEDNQPAEAPAIEGPAYVLFFTDP